MHYLGIVQWNSTRRDHPGNPGGVSGSGPVKARLIARGFTQEYVIDYKETFAHVVRLSSVMTLIAVFAAHKWPFFQMDVKNAFLNGELSKKVYMKLPLGYSHPLGFPHRVFRL